MKITEFKVVSRGTKKAQIIVTLEDGSRETRHLQWKSDCWKDRFGNTYRI